MLWNYKKDTTIWIGCRVVARIKGKKSKVRIVIIFGAYFCACLRHSGIETWFGAQFLCFHLVFFCHSVRVINDRNHCHWIHCKLRNILWEWNSESVSTIFLMMKIYSKILYRQTGRNFISNAAHKSDIISFFFFSFFFFFCCCCTLLVALKFNKFNVAGAFSKQM